MTYEKIEIGSTKTIRILKKWTKLSASLQTKEGRNSRIVI